MKKYLAFVLLLSACATNSHLYNDENGNPVYKANCSGAYLSFAECLEVMGKTCPAGFNVLISSEQQTGTVSDYNLTSRTSGNAFGNSYSSANANIYGMGNNIYGNAYSNTYSNAYFNTRSNYNMGGYSTAVINRYVVYSCKLPLDPKK